MRKPLFFHPYLFALSPILFIFSRNPLEIPPQDLILPVLLSLGFAFILIRLFGRITKSSVATAALATIFIIIFFCYGELRAATHGLIILGVEIGKQRNLMAFWALGLAALLFTAQKLKKHAEILNRFFNSASAFVIFFSLYSILSTPSLFSQRSNLPETEKLTEATPGRQPSKRLPDIYYIILDGYARADILKRIYHYDNTPFLDWLKQKGFFIAEQSRSNYSQTVVSLPSSLNFTYLDDISAKAGRTSRDTRPLKTMIKNNRLAEFLKSRGYKTVSFASGWHFTEIKNADIYQSNGWHLGEFHHAILNTTPLPVFFDKVFSLSFQYDFHRNQILYILEHLADRPDVPEPVFVFAHIIAPHPPFVFDEKGGPVGTNRGFSFDDGDLYRGEAGLEEYIKRYPEQLAFISQKIRQSIEQILSRSPIPPIIILQGDHGPGAGLNWESPEQSDLDERMSILNAYYFPDQNYQDLYPAITPVNSFRIVLNHYFGCSYELLNDRCFFSNWHHPYDLKDITRKLIRETD